MQREIEDIQRAMTAADKTLREARIHLLDYRCFLRLVIRELGASPQPDEDSPEGRVLAKAQHLLAEPEPSNPHSKP